MSTTKLMKTNKYVIKDKNNVAAEPYEDEHGYRYDCLNINMQRIGLAYVLVPSYDGEEGHQVVVEDLQLVKIINRFVKEKDPEKLFKLLWKLAVP